MRKREIEFHEADGVVFATSETDNHAQVGVALLDKDFDFADTIMGRFRLDEQSGKLTRKNVGV